MVRGVASRLRVSQHQRASVGPAGLLGAGGTRRWIGLQRVLHGARPRRRAGGRRGGGRDRRRALCRQRSAARAQRNYGQHRPEPLRRRRRQSVPAVEDGRERRWAAHAHPHRAAGRDGHEAGGAVYRAHHKHVCVGGPAGRGAVADEGARQVRALLLRQHHGQVRGRRGAREQHPRAIHQAATAGDFGRHAGWQALGRPRPLQRGHVAQRRVRDVLPRVGEHGQARQLRRRAVADDGRAVLL
mmetsp:Transcript_15150/g.52646  ORF Transcript_15150/g.52646 Transcript_15150/m.52646 type:complete len:242 (-) Transcript_15150:243-968(-)